MYRVRGIVQNIWYKIGLAGYKKRMKRVNIHAMPMNKKALKDMTKSKETRHATDKGNVKGQLTPSS